MEDTEHPDKEFVLQFIKLSTSAIFWVESCVIQPVCLTGTILTI